MLIRSCHVGDEPLSARNVLALLAIQFRKASILNDEGIDMMMETTDNGLSSDCLLALQKLAIIRALLSCRSRVPGCAFPLCHCHPSRYSALLWRLV